MVQVVPQSGGLFGRIGKGFGEGLSEQIPKEVDRYRLSKGLQKLEKEGGNLSPEQYITRVASIPTALEHPQLIQTLGELQRQRQKGNALKDFQGQQNQPPQPSSSPFPQTQSTSQNDVPSQIPPTLTTEQTAAEAQQTFIPRTEDEKLRAAGQKYNANPAIYGNDPNKAIEYENKVDETNRQIAEAKQTRHVNLSNIQKNVVDRLQDQSTRLGVEIPAKVYSKIEDEAIQATKPKKEGGEGLTEDQAKKIYGDKLDEVSRDYKAIESLGNWGITQRKPSSTLSSIKALQKKFKKRDDTENFADTLIAKNKLTPMFAYAQAEPVSEVKPLNDIISKLPKIYNTRSEDPEYETLQIAPKLAEAMGKEGSPLAVAYELKKLGYDPDIWMDYLTNNKDKLLPPQGRQLDKPRNFFGNLNDWWLSTWSGIKETK